MSKLRYSAISVELGLAAGSSTQAVDPIRPSSSAPHQAKRNVLRGRWLARFWATSSRAADPLPLSLMPGPAGTESRWAPAITTLSSFAPLLLGDHVLGEPILEPHRDAGGRPGWASAAPSANEAPMTGIVRAPTAESAGAAALPMNSGSRSGVLPWLKMITAPAPAAWALWAFRAKLHPPRWMRAIAPAGKPAKSFGPAGSGDERGADGGLGERAVASTRVGPRRRQVDVDRDHVGLDVAESGPRVATRRVGGLHRRELLQIGDADLVGERHALDVPAGSLHRLDTT